MQTNIFISPAYRSGVYEPEGREYLVSDDFLSHHDAVAACAEQNATLANIKTPELMTWLEDNLLTKLNGTPCGSMPDRRWVHNLSITGQSSD